jgi:hypothetical protein
MVSPDVGSHYLSGHPFIVETDHNNLRFMQKAIDRRVTRWRPAIQDYDFVVHHIPGKANVVADALSRCCVIDVKEGNSELLSEAINVPETLQKFHSPIVGHHGIGVNLKLLKDNGYHWPSMRSDVVSFIQSCAECQKSRVTKMDCSQPERYVIEAYESFEEVSTAW